MQKVKIIICLLSGILLASFTKAQNSNTGMGYSQFGGTMSTYENPAFGASLNTKWETQIFDFSELLENNAVKFKLGNLLSNKEYNLNDVFSFDKNKQFSMRNVLEMHGPAAFYNYKNSFAFGLSTRTRFFFQLRDINTTLANDFIQNDGFDFSNSPIIQEDYFNMNFQVITDIGLTGSARVLKVDKHELYAGGALRYYTGGVAMDITGKDIYLDPNKLVNNDSTLNMSADLQLNASMPTGFDLLNGMGNQNGNVGVSDILNSSLSKPPGSGFGVDLGAVYKGELLDHAVRASISLTDFGQMSYKKGTQYSASFKAKNVSIPLDSLENMPGTYDSIREYLANYGVSIDTGSSSFKQKLPTRLTLYAETQIAKGFYVGVHSALNLAAADSRTSSYASLTSIIPRWQSKQIEVWAPFSYNYFSKSIRAGVGARLSVFYFGTDDIFSFARSEIKGLNFYMGLRVAGFFPKQKEEKGDDDLMYDSE